MKILSPLGFATAALLGTTSMVEAVTIYGLTTSNGLISFDSATPGTITTIGTISQAGIVDIDFYPVNGLLYAFTGTGAGYRINLTNGTATLVVTPGTALDGTVTDIDFNPAADRVRIFTNGTTTENYRLTPDVFNNTGLTAGQVTADGLFNNSATDPAVLVANAYTNPFDGVTATSLYSIDTTSDRLVLHSGSPDFNVIGTVGTNLGVAIGSNVGFDIGQNGIAYLSNDQLFYTVNLTNGVATAAGTVGGTGLKSIAVAAVPEPSTAALASLGLLGVLARRRRQS